MAKDLEKQDAYLATTHKTVIDIITKFRYEIMRCVNCPIILECAYPKKRLDKLKKEATGVAEDIYDEEVELDNSAENLLRAQNKRDLVYKQYIQDNAHKCLQNDRCTFERKEIITSLEKFVDAGYDITDPRTYLIINELVGNILNSGRANKSFTSMGMVLKKETAAGPIYYQNPLLKVKLDFSKQIIEATEALDRILKSDESQAADKSFTEHLLKELKIRETHNKKLIHSVIDQEKDDA